MLNLLSTIAPEKPPLLPGTNSRRTPPEADAASAPNLDTDGDGRYDEADRGGCPEPGEMPMLGIGLEALRLAGGLRGARRTALPLACQRAQCALRAPRRG
jgi:hypothetical protein